MEKQQQTLTQIEREEMSGEDLDASKRLKQKNRSSRNKKRAEFIKYLRNGSVELDPLVQRVRNKKYERFFLSRFTNKCNSTIEKRKQNIYRHVLQGVLSIYATKRQHRK